MKVLRDLLDQAEPLFHKGGRLEKFYALYEAADTFLYTPGRVTDGPTHVRDGIDLKRTMITVVVALVPCIFMAMWNTGYQINLAMQQMGAATTGEWRGIIIDILGIGYNPSNPLANVFHGFLYFFQSFWSAIWWVAYGRGFSQWFASTRSTRASWSRACSFP